jgi:hypothetical protein
MPTKTPALHRLVHWRPSFLGTKPSTATMPWAMTRHDKDATYADVLQLQSVPHGHGVGNNDATHGQPLRTMGSQKQQQRRVHSPDYVWQHSTRIGVNNTGYGNNARYKTTVEG